MVTADPWKRKQDVVNRAIDLVTARKTTCRTLLRRVNSQLKVMQQAIRKTRQRNGVAGAYSLVDTQDGTILQNGIDLVTFARERQILRPDESVVL